MPQRIRHRLDGNTEEGFTSSSSSWSSGSMATLLGIAIASYLGYRDRAANNTARANLRAALPSAEGYYTDNGTYVGMNAAALKAIDSGVSSTLTVASAAAASYCLTDTVNSKTWSVQRPGPTAADWHASNNCT